MEFSGVMKILFNLIWVIVTQMYAFVKFYLTVRLRSVHFTGGKLYLHLKKRAKKQSQQKKTAGQVSQQSKNYLEYVPMGTELAKTVVLKATALPGTDQVGNAQEM